MGKESCPKCGGNGIEIIYGYIIDINKFPKDCISGGCCVSDDSPDFKCSKCGHWWQRSKKNKSRGER